MVQHFTFRKQFDAIRGYLKPRGPQTKKDEQEYGPGKTNILVCEKCQAFYWYKSWHRNLQGYPKLNENKNIKFTICPACQMIKNKQYEGEILMYNVPSEMVTGIRKLIDGYGQRAFENDPMDRVISVTHKKIKRVTDENKRGAESRKEFQNKSILEIRTTENQMAKRLAKKINEVYRNKFDISISNSKREDAARIELTFKGQ